ncbi:MAG: hypothetical protein AAFY41_08005 [Bacteroidota bacterium]
MIKNGFALALIFSFGFFSMAQSQEERKIYLELEPLQFASSGFSIVGHYALNNRWQIGTNVFASELSEGFNDLVFDFDESIDLLATQNFGINLSIRYFLNEENGNKGWVVSFPVGYEQWTLEDRNTNLEEDYNFWYISPRIGYLWYPIKKERFYILGEVAAILPLSTDGEVNIGSSEIEINPFIPLPGLGLGFRF